MTDTPLPPTPPARPAASAAPRPEPPRDVLTPRMIESFTAIRPWARFIAIFGYVMTGLMLLAAVVMLVQAASLGARHQKGVALMLGVSALYAVLAVLVFVPSRMTLRYSQSIRLAMNSRSKSLGLEQALVHESALWRFLGIATVVMLGINIPLTAAAVIIPFVSSRQTAKQRQTAVDMKNIVAALAAYEEAEQKFPNADNIHALANRLEPNYIATLPRSDGWSRNFVYRGSDCTLLGCRSYLLYSGGRNGELEDQGPYDRKWPSATKGFDGDIVVSSGVFVRVPEGINF